MKKETSKKLRLGKIKVSDLTSHVQSAGADQRSGACSASYVIACMSQGAPVCSKDSCII
ncbi:hypothetical protein [Chitinophaga sp. HK235]|uniref:hypothetical protein n=1 Tax=Chitinophaga sp. HK235 TaxID=2952571 RepID=UPI001BA64E87|nr:hypothetical protein [Chitinophaga sp. HK235]